MNEATLCAWHILQARVPRQSLELVFATDRTEQFRRADLERMFAPWSTWAPVADYVPVRQADDVDTLGSKSQSHRLIVSLVKDMDLAIDIRHMAAEQGTRVIEPVYPPPGLDNDLVREVAHHDFELGGKNEWDGADTKYSGTILRRLSSAHCYDEFPHWAFQYREPNDTVQDVLDIGCGPISTLRWGALSGFLRIAGVDPLLEMYSVVLARHGLDRLDAMDFSGRISATAERLRELVPPAMFDAVFTNNALDHTQRPEEVMMGIEHVLKPSGRAVIQGATREGTRQNWDQLHKTDLFVRDGTIMYAHRDQDARPLLALTPALKLERIEQYTPEWLSFSLIRT